jgi:putative membrane protein
MKLMFRIVAIILFIVFFGFALKNTQEATLHFFLGYAMQAPLVIMLLGFFAAGAAFGILAMTPTLFRHRRDLGRSHKTLHALQKDIAAQQAARSQPPQPDSV